MSSNEAAASWYILHEGKKKEGPYTLAQLLAIVPTPKMRIRQAHDSTWHAWVNASQYYPELAIVGLVQTLDPLLLQSADKCIDIALSRTDVPPRETTSA